MLIPCKCPYTAPTTSNFAHYTKNISIKSTKCDFVQLRHMSTSLQAAWILLISAR